MNEETKRQLEAFIKPRSVAVVGASDRLGAWGFIILRNLLGARFPGRIYPVNHKAENISGLKTYPRIGDVKEAVDLAVLAVPAEAIPEVVRACVEKGVRGIAIIAAGFGEAVEGGREEELALARMAREHGVRILGPNISGTFNLHDGFNASAAHPDFIVPTRITGICQGSYAIYDLLMDSYIRGMGIGQFVHTGNESDLEVADFLEYFGEDPRTDAVVMYLETLRDVERFREVASRVAVRKPVIVQKLGKTPGGSRAARSHTGALSGDQALYQALFKQLNLVPSPTLERLFLLAHAFTALPPMRGNRVGIITMGGSWGVALTDKLEERGLRVPELGPALQKRLRQMGMPVRASTRNPIDIGAAVSVALTAETVSGMGREVLLSGEVDALILHGFGRLGSMKEPESPTAVMAEIEKNVMRACASLSEAVRKPVLVASAVHPGQSPAVRDLIEEGVLVFYHLDDLT